MILDPIRSAWREFARMQMDRILDAEKFRLEKQIYNHNTILAFFLPFCPKTVRHKIVTLRKIKTITNNKPTSKFFPYFRFYIIFCVCST